VGTFGEKLRKQRERRGIELEAISNTTKISTRMLRALEDENFDQLPGGVFNKGFVRAYARQIGLNEEQAVAEYLEALRDSQLQQQSITPDFRAPAVKPTPVAAPDLGNQAPPASPIPDNVLPSAGLAANDSNKDGGTDQKDDQKDDHKNDNKNDHKDNDKDELTEKRRKQARRIEERRNEERRIEDRRLEARRIEARRDEDRPDEDRRDEDLRNEGLPNEDRPKEDSHRQNQTQTQTQTKDFPALPASTPQAAAANPPASRFRQKYPAGDPMPADQSSVSVPWGKLALALLLVTLILAFWNFRRNPKPTATSPALASSNQSPAPAPGPAPTATQSSGSAKPLTGSASPAGPSSAGTPATVSAPATPPANSAPPTRTAARTPAAKPPPTFTLLIRAEESTWVSLTADGEPVVTNETLIAPAQTSVRATREIVVKTGNAAGISFLLNGKSIPAQGNEGEPRTYVVDATGVHVAQ
jgi:Helix-turn-helix domain/Domain of unknown function (DUF4115)